MFGRWGGFCLRAAFGFVIVWNDFVVCVWLVCLFCGAVCLFVLFDCWFIVWYCCWVLIVLYILIFFY